MAAELNDIHDLQQLTTPARNNYFYGKLLDEDHLRLEQNYGNYKRWWLNRLTLGTGVLDGLSVEPSDQDVKISTGLAIDQLGREVIVPDEPALIVDPRQLTNVDGNPTGETIAEDGVVVVSLLYHEYKAEDTRSFAAPCEIESNTCLDTIREGYRVVIRRSTGGTEPETAQPLGIDLATVSLRGTAQDITDRRHLIQTGTQASQLILDLAKRVVYESGDAQQAAPGATLNDPIVVKVLDFAKRPVVAAEVTFQVRGGDGLITPFIPGPRPPLEASLKVKTNLDGFASVRWILGSSPGLNTVEATIATGASTTFRALALAPPVINAIWPPNGATIAADDALWSSQPQIAITFDRLMAQMTLVDPNLISTWLRVWHLSVEGTKLTNVTLTPIAVRFLQTTMSLPGHIGFTVLYALEPNDLVQPGRYLIQIRATDASLRDSGALPQLLDETFAGTRLTAEDLDPIWQQAGPVNYPMALYELADPNAETLPSGDRSQRNRFHSWFQIAAPLPSKQSKAKARK